MFCKQCGAQLASGVRFCMTCGQAVEAAPQSFTQPQPESTGYNFNAFEEPEKPRKKPPIKWIAIGAAAIVAVLVTVISISAAEDAKYLKPGNSPTLADSLSSIKVDEAAQAKCADLAATIPSDATIQALISRTGVMNKYAAGTARKASSFVNATGWIDSTVIADISTAMDDALIGGLDEVIAKTPTIRESDRSAFAAMWAEEFKTAAIKSCGIENQMNAAIAAESGFTAAKSSLESLASSVPWYPDGYTEWKDDSNVAWKWINGRDCSYSYCWHVGLVSLTGCPSGVYVEINILDSGDNVIDYSNGTLSSLAPGQRGIVEINNSYSATGQVTQISCHQ